MEHGSPSKLFENVLAHAKANDEFIDHSGVEWHNEQDLVIASYMRPHANFRQADETHVRRDDMVCFALATFTPTGVRLSSPDGPLHKADMRPSDWVAFVKTLGLFL